MWSLVFLEGSSFNVNGLTGFLCIKSLVPAGHVTLQSVAYAERQTPIFVTELLLIASFNIIRVLFPHICGTFTSVTRRERVRRLPKVGERPRERK